MKIMQENKTIRSVLKIMVKKSLCEHLENIILSSSSQANISKCKNEFTQFGKCSYIDFANKTEWEPMAPETTAYV